MLARFATDPTPAAGRETPQSGRALHEGRLYPMSRVKGDVRRVRTAGGPSISVA